MSPRRLDQAAVALVALLLIGFAVNAYSAALTKSATADEPLHAVAGFVRLHHADFRVDPEDPPLFMYWAMIPHRADALKIDKTNPAWDEMLGYMWRQWRFVTPELYHTPGVDPEKFINRSRAMMTAWGVALGAIVAVWAWLLGGRWAAVIGTAMFSFDPGFLGHSPLVKNDVPLATMLAGLMLATFLAGQRLTIWRAVSVALLCAMAVNVKFSGLLLLPMVAVLLIVRALLNRPWVVFGSLLTDRLNKLGAAAALLVISGLACYVAIWACYGLRYSATPDQTVRLNMPLITKAGVRNLMRNESGGVEPDEAELQRRIDDPPLIARTILSADDKRLLPQAWLAGLLDTWATTLRRAAYLHGEFSEVGWRTYFPLAVLYKTPLATLVAWALAVALWIGGRLGRRTAVFDQWAALALAVPLVMYGYSAITAHLNLGVRHVFPMYPMAFVWSAVTIASAARRMPRTILVTSIVLIGALAGESLASRPHYIAFFNAAVGGPRGGYKLLGDSNLDWGQDLPLLRDWQAKHPDVDLLLDISSGTDPASVVRHTPLLAAPEWLASPAPEGRRRVLAVGATNLQATYAPYAWRPIYQHIASHQPFEVLGGTIYLYELPLKR